ncbi:MAG: sigma-70 family RNA polymerase sigma factor [Planctomycetes bacterium]|nr:sigma-70 family RNA polymerase sigma factor [Planctomycetota bacterium]
MDERKRRSQPQVDTGDDLLDRFRSGDAAAFDQLVATYETRLVQYFYRLCWDLDRAEDLTQTLFLKLLRGVGRYRPEGRLGTYVFRVATNLWIDHYRKTSQRRRLYSLDQAIDGGFEPAASHPGTSPALVAEDHEERARLRRALERLTEPHRLVFELAVYQELPYAEVAAILDIPIGTVKSRMHNSVRALKELLSEPGESAAPDRGAFRQRAESNGCGSGLRPGLGGLTG